MGWLCGRIAIRFYLTAVGIGHDLLLVLNPLHALGAPKVLKQIGRASCRERVSEIV